MESHDSGSSSQEDLLPQADSVGMSDDQLAHTEEPYFCPVCAAEVTIGQECSRSDCPRIAVERLRTAAVDTPFKVGL